MSQFGFGVNDQSFPHNSNHPVAKPAQNQSKLFPMKQIFNLAGRLTHERRDCDFLLTHNSNNVFLSPYP